MTLDEKYDKLVALLKEMGSVVIGFSGGVDSTFLAYAAYAALGNQAIAVTAVSATLPKKEAGDARNMIATCVVSIALLRKAITIRINGSSCRWQCLPK